LYTVYWLIPITHGIPMNSPVVQALLIYGIAAGISFLVAGLIQAMNLFVGKSRKEAE
jgi:hypothetical protein